MWCEGETIWHPFRGRQFRPPPCQKYYGSKVATKPQNKSSKNGIWAFSQVIITGIYLPLVEAGFRSLRSGLLATTYLDAFDITHRKKANAFEDDAYAEEITTLNEGNDHTYMLIIAFFRKTMYVQYVCISFYVCADSVGVHMWSYVYVVHMSTIYVNSWLSPARCGF